MRQKSFRNKWLIFGFISAVYAQDTSPETEQTPVQVKRKVILRSESEKQAVGRQTLSGDQIKYAPATFGDSLNALTTLPGVMRTEALFGSLVIRGAGDEQNRYFVDGIPIPRPQHFGGLHSVLNNDIVKEASVYASAFPVMFGNATGAVIDFRTVDEVQQFGGVIDVGLLSANFLLKSPWPGGEARPPGFWITAARVGYLPLVVPPIYSLITGQPILALPQYYDYQIKGRIVVDDKGDHQLSLLALGSYDTVKVQRRATGSETSYASDLKFLRAGATWDLMSHSVGFYYDYEPSRKLRNNLLVFNTLVMERASYAPTSAGQEFARNHPNMAGIKNSLSLAWLDGTARLNLGLEYMFYYLLNSSATSVYDYVAKRSNLVTYEDANFHHVPSAYLENRFQFGIWKFVPGVRVDYLPLSRYAAVGPRGLAGCEVYPGTSIEVAGGVYQSFPQINTEYMDNFAYDFRKLTSNADLSPEEAVHRSVALLRKYKLWDFKLEGYWNNYYRQVTYTNLYQTGTTFYNEYYGQNMGAEFSVRKAPDAATGGIYGWASYTLSRSEQGRYLGMYDQTHNLKIVAGFLTGIHSISTRIEVFSGFPYSPIVGSQASAENPNFHYPVYGSYYSQHYPIAHRISLRYGQERTTSWGSWRWYVEVVNATNYAPLGAQNFDQTRPYEPGVNPTLEPWEPRIPILPNFGVEVRF